MLRTAIARTSNPLRALSTSAVARNEVVGTVGAVPRSRPVGGFRSGILGFLLGFSACSALTIYYLQQDTQTASALLLGSVEELHQGTGKITTHLDRLQSVEKELSALKAQVAAKEDVSKLRGEVKKVYDGLHVEVLDLRAHVWGVEQDLSKIVKHDSIQI